MLPIAASAAQADRRAFGQQMKRNEQSRPWLDEAKAIACQMMSGEKDAHYGCDQIEIICEKNNWPEELLALAHLAHLQKGHEDLGFTRDSLKKDILQEANKLIGRENK